MNIAFLADAVDPARGGADRCIVEDARGLAGAGHRVSVLTGPGADLGAASLVEEVRIRVPRFARERRVAAFAEGTGAWLNAHREAVSVSFAPSGPVDVHFPHGGCWKAWREAEERSFLDPEAGRRRGRQIDGNARQMLFRGMEERLMRSEKPPFLIALSGRVRDDFVRSYGIDPVRCEVLPNALGARSPASDGVRAEVRARWGVPSDAVIGFFAAHNFRLKGLSALVQAVGALPEPARDALTIAVAGKDSGVPFLREARALRCDHVFRFLGALPSLHGAFAASDFLAQPTFYDPYSLTTLEALAAGLPVVTSRANGASEAVLAAGAGWVVDDAGAADALATALGQAIDPAARSRAAAAARSAPTPITPKDRLDRLVSILERATSGPRSTRCS